MDVMATVHRSRSGDASIRATVFRRVKRDISSKCQLVGVGRELQRGTGGACTLGRLSSLTRIVNHPLMGPLPQAAADALFADKNPEFLPYI